MKDTLKSYIEQIKSFRTAEGYDYTDEDFEKHKNYIIECYNSGLSSYKCLEIMYFETIKTVK
tara:strand:+ start:112 stop:297 length:186 start_codon:yes stop_codon:yes gene_type:complete